MEDGQISGLLLMVGAYPDIATAVLSRIKLVISSRLCLEGFIKRDPLNLYFRAQKLSIEVVEADYELTEAPHASYRFGVDWTTTCKRIIAYYYFSDEPFEYHAGSTGRFIEFLPLSQFSTDASKPRVDVRLHFGFADSALLQKDLHGRRDFKVAIAHLLQGRAQLFQLSDGTNMYTERGTYQLRVPFTVS